MDSNGKVNTITHKPAAKRGVLFPVVSALLIAAFAIGVQCYKHLVYEVFINGTSIGYVKEYDVYKAAVDSIAKTDGHEATAEVQLEHKLVFEHITNQDTSEQQADSQKHYVSSEEIESLARTMLVLKQPAAALCVNGVTLATVADTTAADKVVAGITAYYTPSDSSIKVVSIKIKEDIEINPVYEYTKNLLGCDEAISKIVAGAVSPKTYTIQSGDTIWDIAIANDVSLDDIQALNPELNMNMIHAGDQINLSAVVPYVNVEMVADITSKETIAYETTKKYDSSLLKGTTKVLTKGANGLKELVVKTTKINGITTEQEILSSTVLKEAVNEVLAVGTKVVYVTTSRGTSSVSASGFIRPTSGILTSNYGYRKREFHQGIDLASSIGTPIVASKAGTVVYSGWKGGYGYCIIIDHGSGIETLYGHNSKLLVGVGDYVAQGQLIAQMGSTGNSTGPHCHFEVRINGLYQNPWNYID